VQKKFWKKPNRCILADNFQPRHNDSAPETLPTKGELAEEGYLQKAKLDLMTSEDTQASRATFDYIDNLRRHSATISTPIFKALLIFFENNKKIGM
jgi:hypothetical protein